MTAEYNPIDLAFLVNGWIQGAAEKMKGDYEGIVKALRVERVMMLEDVAKMLARLYEEVQDEWTGDWEYEVAEPLGIWIGRASGRVGCVGSLFMEHGAIPEAEIEAKARDIIAALLTDADNA